MTCQPALAAATAVCAPIPDEVPEISTVLVVGTVRPYAGPVSAADRPASVQDVHEIAAEMPHVTVYREQTDHPVYQVGGKSFVFFRTPRPDAVDPGTGERFTDVIVIWVPSEEDKRALVLDRHTPFFSTAHFNGHLSVLL